MQLSWQIQTDKRKATMARENRARHTFGLRAADGLASLNSDYCLNFSVVNKPEQVGFISNPSLSDCGQLKI